MTKDKVLAILKAADGFVSGEKISADIGVSRMAVSVAVKSLRADGYDISSVTNRGYRLNNAPDNLTAGEIMAYLPDGQMQNVFCFDAVDSTNNRLKEMALCGAKSGTFVIANEQTSGRGRLSRTFDSPKGKGVYLSVLFRPDCSPADSMALTAWAAVATRRAISSACGARCGIKWVNDLVIGKKKVCGILTEMSLEGESGHIEYVIIGIGVNVRQSKSDFKGELKDKATSIFIETGKAVPRAEVAACMISELQQMMRAWPGGKDEFLAEYRQGGVTVGERVQIVRGNEKRYAEAVRINDDFSLRVRYDDGSEQDLSSGEVSVRGMYDYV